MRRKAPQLPAKEKTERQPRLLIESQNPALHILRVAPTAQGLARIQLSTGQAQRLFSQSLLAATEHFRSVRVKTLPDKCDPLLFFIRFFSWSRLPCSVRASRRAP